MALMGTNDAEYTATFSRIMWNVLTIFPRWDNGAISHRPDCLEARAEFVFMVPPAIAYQAIVEDDDDLLTAAINQCLWYDKILAEDFEPTGAAWQHVVKKPYDVWADDGLWATASALAVTGMIRVLATASKWRYAANSRFLVSSTCRSHWGHR